MTSRPGGQGKPTHARSKTEHSQDHSDPADHDHEHPPGQEHTHDEGNFGWLRELLPFGHGHSHADLPVDDALEASDRGIWAVKVSLVILGVTAAFQVAIYIISGSVGLLADTIHNFSDALTAVPLWLAFTLSKRPPNRTYTYGYGRAEDVAGVIIVVMIAASAGLAGYEAIQKLFNLTAPQNLLWVAVASIVGFLGNEAVAVFRTRVGKQIGSAALVADGQHARVDGLTSLAVLLGVIGAWLGFPVADPLVGLLITVVILAILRDTALTMWRRLMDAVDPEYVSKMEQAASRIEGVLDVHDVRIRWIGHRLQAELHVTVDEDLPTYESHKIIEKVRHELFHELPKLAYVNVHADPCGLSGSDPHEETAHHSPSRAQKSGSQRT